MSTPPPVNPPTAAAAQAKPRSGAVIGGWVCFGLGVLLMFVSLWSFVLYTPLFIVAFVLAIVAIAKGRVGQGITMLLASIAVPLVLFVGLGATRTTELAKTVADKPNVAAAAAAQATAEETYSTSAMQLFRDYDENEVATAQQLKGKVVEVTGRVQSIDKDVFDHVLVKLRTSNEFMSATMVMGDSEAAKAAALRKGDSTVVRCGEMQRMMGSPYGSGCVFVK